MESEFAVNFEDYFAAELQQIQQMQADGLLEIDERHININDRGRLLIRNICKVFDRYRADQEGRFSKLI